MQQQQAEDVKQAMQQQADIQEDLELRQWKVMYPRHTHWVRLVGEAARRAESVARLEDALRRLG